MGVVFINGKPLIYREPRKYGMLNDKSKVEHTFFDTILSPEGVEFQVGNTLTLFGSQGIGKRETNLPTSWLSSDASFTIGALRAAIFFDGADTGVYGHIQAGTFFTPIVNGKRTRPSQLLHVYENEKGIPKAWPGVEFIYRIGPVGVHPREPFEVEVMFTRSTIKLINEWKGKRFFRLFMDGILARETC